MKWRIVFWITGLLAAMLAVSDAKQGWYYHAAVMAYLALDLQRGSSWMDEG